MVKKKISQSLAIYVISFQFSLPCRQNPNRKIRNVAWLGFQNSKYWYSSHIAHRKVLKVVLYKCQSAQSHLRDWQEFFKKISKGSRGEGEGRKG